jgi:hypothetical protein
MERKSITGPETAHLEQVELERTPHGIVISTCTRFEPPCAVHCTRECARRMDRRDRLAIDDRWERVLVIHADAPWMRSIAEYLASLLARDQLIVDVAAASDTVPPLADYEAVVIGTVVRLGRLPRSIARYIARNREILETMPSFLFSLGRITEFLGAPSKRTGWVPRLSAAFVRPRGLARWFGDPEAAVACNHGALRGFALAIGDEIPALEHGPW